MSGVNSINWARILAQIVYYFTAAAALGAPDRRIAFAVPTGNFGDVLAGYYAKGMGLPISRLTIATNENDILARALATGLYKPLGVKATQSPSMDIQVSSNFERLLFEVYGRDAGAVRGLMGALKQAGEFSIAPPSTAHPAKFPEAVERAIGRRPELPPHLAEVVSRREHYATLANDPAAVARFVRERARVAA